MTTSPWILDVDVDQSPELSTPRALARRFFTLVKERDYRLSLLDDHDDDGTADIDHLYVAEMRVVANRLTEVRSAARSMIFDKLRVFETLADDNSPDIPSYAWDLFHSAMRDVKRSETEKIALRGAA